MPIPALYGMEHVGFTVPDIDAACRWFERILGAETLYTAATNFRHDEDDWMQVHLRVSPRAVIKEFRYMRVGNGTNFEVFEYSAPHQSLTPPKNSDIGGHHFAFYVEDMDAAIAFLKENDVEVLGEPTAYAEGPNLGLTWCYFLTPWGQQLEIVSAPHGTAYDNECREKGGTRLFHPKYAAETLVQP